MTYHEQAYAARHGSLGDEAEAVFEAVRPFGRIERYGWDRPDNISFRHVPLVPRHTPDYYATGGYLVEVMGCGKDNILKGLKVKKYEALKWWASMPNVELILFLWNSHLEQWCMLNWEGTKRLVAKNRSNVAAFHDGNEYFPLPWDDIVASAFHKGEYHG